MNIVDAIILVILIIGAISGFSRGLVKQAVLLAGLALSLVISFYMRVKVATFFYTNLPFFNFSGVFKGMGILNILVYELIAFLIIFSILYLVLRILLKISGLIEKILKMTIILGFFSKIGGAIVGLVESYVIIFIMLFIFKQPFINIKGLEDSKAADPILTKTPIMSDSIKNTKVVIDEIYDLTKQYKEKDEDEFNNSAIDLFIKYDIVSKENVDLLREKGKLK